MDEIRIEVRALKYEKQCESMNWIVHQVRDTRKHQRNCFPQFFNFSYLVEYNIFCE